MSNSSTARLSFGVAFEEDFEFPWSDRQKYDDGITDWWKEVNNYIQPPELFTFDTIYNHQSKWLKLNPPPIEIVRSGSYEYSISIIATKTMIVDWGETLEITSCIFNEKKVEDDSKIILDFLNKYNVEHEDSPKWLLSSYYG